MVQIKKVISLVTVLLKVKMTTMIIQKSVNEDTKVITTQKLESDLMSNLDDELAQINKIDQNINTKIEAYEEKMDDETPEKPPP